MALQIVVPRLGWSMEEGTFGEWLKKDGDSVEMGEPLFVLEGEKSAQDIESVDRGILRIPPGAPRPGDIVKVGQVIGWFVEPGEATPAGTGSAPTLQSTASANAPPASHPATASPPPPQSAPAAVVRETIASPRARRAARELGIELHLVTGTGRTGRIRETDVVSASLGTGEAPRRQPATAAVAGPPSRSPLSSIRKTIAARMHESSQTTATVTLHRRCDATNLVNLRAQFKSGQPGRGIPTFTDLIVKLTGCVLAEFPDVRTQWHPEGLVTLQEIDIAVAVDTEQGLLAPVVRHVDQRGIRQLSDEIRTLVESARAGRLTADQLRGGTFTITNLGTLGVESFTPIINLPQAAILGLGRIAREPVVREEQIVIRDQLPLSLTFDHRILDGAPAARFLQALSQAIENPGPWLMS